MSKLNHAKGITLQEHIIKAIESDQTITKALTADPKASIEHLREHLLKDISIPASTTLAKGIDKLSLSTQDLDTKLDWSAEELAQVRKLGNFNGCEEPSELFLKMYGSTLISIEDDYYKGMVAPALMGSNGIVTVSVISVIPDIIKHYAVLCAAAQTEILIATNYLEDSHSIATLKESFLKFNETCKSQNRTGIIKFLYDRGTPTQVLKNHQIVPSDKWKEVGLPTEKELTHIKMECVNYHKPPLGTFHSKFLIVDRKFGVVNSNNIQDRCNVEMMVQVEGKIVESFYEAFLLSWNEPFTPTLPTLNTTPVTLSEAYVKSRWETNGKELESVEEGLGINSMESLGKHLDSGEHAEPSTELTDHSYHPLLIHTPPSIPVPISMVCRAAKGKPGHHSLNNPQNLAWIQAFRLAKRKVFIQTPTFNAKSVVKEAIECCKRGVEVELWVDWGFNDLGEQIPGQGGTNENVVIHLYEELRKVQKEQFLKFYWYTAKDQKKPLNASKKSRNCHIKFLAVDDQVAVVGNGNQDTQSWQHSQEINIMVDSPTIIQDWMKRLHENQNTAKYGKIDSKDGLWRDEQGNQLEGDTGKAKGGPLGQIKGLLGAVARVRGKGGF